MKTYKVSIPWHHEFSVRANSPEEAAAKAHNIMLKLEEVTNGKVNRRNKQNRGDLINPRQVH